MTQKIFTRLRFPGRSHETLLSVSKVSCDAGNYTLRSGRTVCLHALLCGGLFLLLWSCQSSYGSKEEEKIEKLLRAGQFPKAAEVHRSYLESYESQDELLFHLNQSNLDYYDSMRQNSLQSRNGSKNSQVQDNIRSPSFERAEDMLRLNDDRQTSFSEQAGQNAHKNYSATLQESLWHNIFASLYYWNRNSPEGPLIELRRNHEKVNIYQQYTEQSKTDLSDREDQQLDFRSSALMQYLGMIYYREDQLQDDWRISRDNLKSATTNNSYYPQPIPDQHLPAVKLSEGSGSINFTVFTGAGVQKYAEGIHIIKVPGGVAVRFTNGKGNAESELGFGAILIPTLSQSFSYYEMMIPIMHKQEDRIDRIVARINGEQEQELYSLEPFAEINMEIFRRLRADFLPKQIISFILKVVASEIAQGVIDDQIPGAGLLVGLAGSALVSVSGPKPDLRVANFSPSQGWVGELQISPGNHTVELLYYSGSNILNRKSLQVEVVQGKSEIIQDYYAH
ncbi:hypothetical protein P0082_06670 [Candidatus Haliotispira prima]|uniref:Lipoprotein n=1 Tax=Candidatus Haliotispira prima TaxID=3034016 RepID=A0ABY8ME27_9SPIO|nr:hypothetical protein P0082_06670 [Candidatus Haliotispira prima]